MKTKVSTWIVVVMTLALLAPAAMAREVDRCEQEFEFPDGFGIAQFGMTEQSFQHLFQCGLVRVGQDEDSHSAVGKIDRVDVSYEFTFTPTARKLFRINLEMLNAELYGELRTGFIARFGQPARDDRGRDNWQVPEVGAQIRMWQSGAYYKIRLQNRSLLVEEAMGYYCDAYHAPPAGIGPFRFGAGPEDVLGALGCGYRFVRQDDSRIEAEGYAFNQPARVLLDFGSAGTLQGVDFIINEMDAYALIENILARRFGDAQSGGSASSKLWRVSGGVQVMLSRTASEIRIRYMSTAR